MRLSADRAFILMVVLVILTATIFLLPLLIGAAREFAEIWPNLAFS